MGEDSRWWARRDEGESNKDISNWEARESMLTNVCLLNSATILNHILFLLQISSTLLVRAIAASA